MLGPRVRVRVRPLCDDECPREECPSAFSHPIVVALATVTFTAIGELLVKRLSQPAGRTFVEVVEENEGGDE